MSEIDEYTTFEQNFALAWAQSHLTEFLRTHPNADWEAKYNEFLQAIEGGLSLAREFTNNHR